MLLKQAAQSPFVFDLEFEDGRKLKVTVPYFTLGDFIDLGNVVDQEHIDRLTKGMEPEKKFQYLNFYGPMPSNLFKLKGLALTPKGIKHVLTQQLPKGRVRELNGEPVVPHRPFTKEEIASIMQFDANALRELVEELTDIPVDVPKDTGTAVTGDGPLPEKSNTESEA